MISSELSKTSTSAEILNESKESKERQAVLEDKFQRYVWAPRHPLSYGYAESLESAISAILINRGKSEKDLEILKNPILPTAESMGIDTLALFQSEERIEKAVKEKQSALVFGDMDTDGVTSTAILFRKLQMQGIRNVKAFTPSRSEYGYGFNPHFANKYGGEFDLIFTIDCGITNKEGVEIAQKKGSDVIVIDHHEIQEEFLPENATILHTTETSAAGIAFLLAKFAEKEFGLKLHEDLSDIAAIGVITDYIAETLPNHAIKKTGIKTLQKAERRSIRILSELARVHLPTLTERDISFTLGPIFNSPSKFGSGMPSLRYLRTDYDGTPIDKVRDMALDLIATNQKRKDVTARYAENIKDENPDQNTPYIFYFTDKKDFPAGLTGPISNRIMNDREVPAFIGKVEKNAIADEPIAIFEARSLDGIINLLPLIEQLKEKGLLIEGGGHPMAAGFAAPQKNLSQIAQMVDHYIRENSGEIVKGTKEVDLEIDFSMIEAIHEWEEEVRPFGKQFVIPTYVTRDATIVNAEMLPKDNPTLHLKLSLEQDGKTYKGLIFSATIDQKRVKVGDRIDVNYELNSNTFRGKTTTELSLIDFREAGRPDIPFLIPTGLPSRSDKTIFNDYEHFAEIPDGFKERIFNGLSHVGFDMDDTLRMEDPVMTKLRYMCFEANFHAPESKKEKFREKYGTVEIDSDEWQDLMEEIAEISEAFYSGNKNLLDPDVQPKDMISHNAEKYVNAYHEEGARERIYMKALGFETADELWDFYSSKFIKGKRFLKRRLDEFATPVPGAVSLLNFLSQDLGSELSIITNSDAGKLLAFEEILRQEGFVGTFDYKYSSGSLKRHKPDPYSLRNLSLQLLRKGHNKMLYVGNNTGDVEFTLNATDIINFPLQHDIDMEKVDIVPVLIQRDAIYPDNMPPHARFSHLEAFEKYLRELTGK